MMRALPLSVYCAVLVLIILLSASTPVAGSKSTATPGTLPLYTDTLTGWQISQAVPGSEVTARYEATLSQFGPLTPAPPSYVLFIFEHGSPFFFMFAVDIPSGTTTYWKNTTELTLIYVHDGDTLTATSNLLFFLSKDLRRMFFVHDMDSEFMVPNPAVQLCQRGETFALFARFDFKHEPDYLLSCVPCEIRSVIRR